MPTLTVQEEPLPHLPDEIWLYIFSNFQLPGASAIGRARYESLIIHPGSVIRSFMKNHVDCEWYPGDCMHEHEQWKAALRTLSAISRVNHRFRYIVTPVLYAVYPGQTLVSPRLFLNTLHGCPEYDGIVKELVIDPWNGVTPDKTAKTAVNELGLGRALFERLTSHARKWDDVEYALLLLLHCSNAEVLYITCPSAWSEESAMAVFLDKLPMSGASPSAALGAEGNANNQVALRKLKHLHLHHAERMHIQRMISLRPLVRCKTIETLTLYRFWYGASALESASHLRELTLSRCSFKSDELLDGLAKCILLKSLKIIFAGFKAILDELALERDRIDYRAFGELVRSKLKTLVTLHIDDRELEKLKPVMLGSLKSMAMLEDLAINEAALGCYDVNDGSGKPVASVNSATAAITRSRLADMLPPNLHSLTVLRTELWWHQSDEDGKEVTQENGRKDLIYRSDAVTEKILDLISRDAEELPQLNVIRIDTPLPLGRDVEKYGWKAARVVDDAKVFTPSIVTVANMTPEEQETCNVSQNLRVEKGSLVLSRVR